MSGVVTTSGTDDPPRGTNLFVMRRTAWNLDGCVLGSTLLNVGGRTSRLNELFFDTCHHAGLDSFGLKSLSFSHIVIMVNRTTRIAA